MLTELFVDISKSCKPIFFIIHPIDPCTSLSIFYQAYMTAYLIPYRPSYLQSVRISAQLGIRLPHTTGSIVLRHLESNVSVAADPRRGVAWYIYCFFDSFQGEQASVRLELGTKVKFSSFDTFRANSGFCASRAFCTICEKSEIVQSLLETASLLKPIRSASSYKLTSIKL